MRITTDSGFAVGEQTSFDTFGGSYVRNTKHPYVSNTTVGYTTSNTTTFGGINKSGTLFSPTAANWKYRFSADRGW